MADVLQPALSERSRRPIPRWLALGAVAGPALFTLAWLVLGFVSPGFTIWDVRIEPYSPISASISGLGLGVTGPWMNAAFIISGLLVTAGVIGIIAVLPRAGSRSQAVAAAALGLGGLGLITDGVFTLEQMMAHTAGFGLAMLGFVVGYFLLGRNLRNTSGWRSAGTLALIVSPLTIVLNVAYFATFSPTAEGALTGIAGLTERILVVVVFLPLVVLGWMVFARNGRVETR